MSFVLLLARSISTKLVFVLVRYLILFDIVLLGNIQV